MRPLIVSLRWLILLAAGCGGDRTLAPPPRETAGARPVAAAALRHAPHSGGIVLVAATEQGEAAFTIDDHGQGRLWPALDGEHEPVVVLVPPARDVVLVTQRDGMLAAVLDRAGGLELIRLDSEGAERGRTRLAPEPGFEDVDPLGDGVLALRRDQVVVHLDARGALRGALPASPGEHVRMILTRGGHAVAGLASDKPPPPRVVTPDMLEDEGTPLAGPTIGSVRELAMDAGLAWGPLHDLPEHLVGAIALSPSGTRLAGLGARVAPPVLMVDLATHEAKPFSQAASFSTDAFLGFLSEDVAIAVSGSTVRWWSVTPPPDLWTAMNYELLGSAETIAAANGRAIGGRDTGLMLFDGTRTQYLGYRHIATGGASVAGTGGAIVSSKLVTWFDRELRERGERTLPTPDGPQLVPLDDEHVLQIDTYPANQRRMSSVYLHGPPTTPPILLGTWPQVRTSAFDPSTGVIAIATEHDSNPSILRFELDRETHTVRALTSLQAKANFIEQVVPLDPATADGAVAVAIGMGDGGGRAVMRFTETSREGDVQSFEDVYALGIDRNGHAYLASRRGHELVIVPPRGLSESIELPASIYLGEPFVENELRSELFDLVGVKGAVSDDGEVIVLYGSRVVIAIDRQGNERWRLGPHAATDAAFFAGTHTVLLSSAAGLATIDGDTGKQLAVACGFSFGLSNQHTSAQLPMENLCSRDD